MTAFADSSALVKLYVDEPGAAVVRSEPFLVVSAVARVEVPAALWRKTRTGDLDLSSAALLLAEFEADWYGDDPDVEARLSAVRLVPGLLDAAARLAVVHGLRAYDAVQLASALTARDAAPEVDVVACFDTGLRAAASAEAFRLLPA